MKTAMKECPYCMSDVPSRAKKCKFCGEWIDGSTDPAVNSVVSGGYMRGFFRGRNMDETFTSGVKWYAQLRIAGAIAGFIVFLIFFFGVFLPQWNRVSHGPPGFGP